MTFTVKKSSQDVLYLLELNMLYFLMETKQFYSTVSVA